MLVFKNFVELAFKSLVQQMQDVAIFSKPSFKKLPSILVNIVIVSKNLSETINWDENFSA